MIEVDYIEGDTEKRLRKLGEKVGLTVRDMSWEEMRLSVNNAISLTYPKKKADGKNRVEKDINKIFVEMSGAEQQAEWDLPGVLGGAVAFKTKTGAVYGVDRDLYRPGASLTEMSKLHNEQRQKSSGRVTTARGGSEVGRNSLDIGRWKFVTKMHVKRAKVRAFKRQQVAKVGKQKAGWMPAGAYFAARSNGRLNAPAWVAKQEKKIGHYVDTMAKSGNGRMEASNDVPYWSTEKRVKVEEIVHRTMQKRINTRTQAQMNKIVERFNAGRI